MEKHPDPFDDFIKKAMKGHRLTPREQARKAFLEEASAIIPVRKGWKYWYYLPVLIIFMSGGIAYITYQDHSEDVVNIPAETSIIIHGTDTTSVLSESSPLKPISKNNINLKLEATTIPPETISSSENKQAIQKTSGISTKNILPVNTSISENTAINGSQQIQTSPSEDKHPESVSPSSNTFTSDTINTTTIIEPVGVAIVVPLSDIKLDTITPVNVPFEALPKEISDPLINDLGWRFAADVYYLPEMMFNTLEDNKFVNNFGLEAIFYHGLVSIRTGVGLSVSKGITKKSIDYNDYLGTYNKLDSVTFTYNETQHDFEPEVFTTSQKVWDSVVQSDSTEIIKRYTYLQLPLVLGFDFWQKGRLSVGVRVGTIMSVLLKSQQLTGAYNAGENQVIGINSLTPAQVSVNWQAIGGFTASAILTKKIGLEIEPQVKYYYGSIYEKSGDVKKPWSVGIRAAVVYKF